MNVKNIIVFSGYNQRAVIAFLRTLKKNKISNYAIIASSEYDTILRTDYADKVLYVRKNRTLNLTEIKYAIELICKHCNGNKSIIVPSTEALNRFVISNKSFFEGLGCEIPLTEKQLYEQISDKEKFWNICRNNNLTVPEIINTGVEHALPVVAKPKKYFSKDRKTYSPVIITSDEDYQKFITNYPVDDFDYQEYIDGESYYLLYYFSTQGDIYKFSQKNYIQQTGGKSILAAACSSVHNECEIALEYEKLFRKLGYHGFVMVELRKCDKKFYMIEANPRFWGPSQLFCDAGYNFFEFFLHDYGLLPQIPKNSINYDAKYFWSGGMNNNECNYVWLGNSKNEIKEKLSEFCMYDIYNRNDTKKIFDYESRDENEQEF